MATTIGPYKLLFEQQVQNTQERDFSLVSGEFLEGDSDESGNPFTSTVGPTIAELTQEPITQYTTFDLSSGLLFSSLEVKHKAYNADGTEGFFIISGSGDGTRTIGTIVVKRGLYYLEYGGSPAQGFNIIEANAPSARAFNPTLFPILSNAKVNSDTGIFDKKLYISIFFMPTAVPNDYVRTIPEYTVFLQLFGKEITETTPPEEKPKNDPDEPAPTDDGDDPEDVDDPEDIPEDPPEPDEPEYSPPEETQLSVRVTDLISQSLYGILVGSEFESEYIETIRQAIRVGEQIIWQSNQTLIFAFSIPFDPSIRRGDTIGIQSSLYALEGFILDSVALVKSVSHVFDSQSGAVTTQIIARGTEYIFQSSLVPSDPTENIDQRYTYDG